MEVDESFAEPIEFVVGDGAGWRRRPSSWRTRWLSKRREEEVPEIVQYSQRDPRWRDYEYHPGFTLGRWGCYITCVAMVASQLYDHTPPEAAENLKEVGALQGSYLNNPCAIPDAYPELYWYGALIWRTVPAEMAVLGSLLSGAPQILEVEFSPGGEPPPHDQHFVLALDFSEDGDLWIIDPWDGAETLLLERYALDHWDLARAIYGVRRLEVGRGLLELEK